MYESTLIVVVNGLGTKRVDIHGLTRYKVLYPSLYLGRTTRIVWTVVSRLTFHTH